MKRRTIALALAGALLGVTLATMPTAALGNASRAASNSTTFTDSVGEDPAAPDITKVVVSNDDAGTTNFAITISNRPTLTEDMLLIMFLDTDQNTQTGDKQAGGADYAIQLVPGDVGLFKWNGSDYVAPPSQQSLGFVYQPTGPTIRINTADLGKSKGFSFGVIVLSGLAFDAEGQLDATNAHRDVAPDSGRGYYHYTVRTQLTLRAVDTVSSPSRAQAGRPFSVGVAATESDTNGQVEGAKVTCTARLGGASLRAATSRLVNGIGICVWSIPKSAHGKTIRGTVTLTKQGARVTRPFASKVL